MLVIKNISKKFGDNTVVNNVSLNITKGEVLAVIGPSGSGKSTFLRCINFIEKPDSGSIEIDGVSINESNITMSRKNIGMVFQNFNLFPHMKVVDNIAYAPINVLKTDAKEAKREAEKLLAKVNMKGFGDYYPDNLSGGQKQRVAIARALAMHPSILLFDEPTSSLDPEMVKEVLEAIKSLAHTGITMIIVTHEMGFAREVADRVAFFDSGKILEEAPPKAFFSAPNTQRAKDFLDKVLSFSVITK